VRLRVALLGMDEMRELGGVTKEEDGGIVEDPVKIAFVSANLDSKTTRITGGIRRARLAANGGETNGSAGLVANCFEERGRSEVGDVVGYLKVAVRASTLSMDLRNSILKPVQGWVQGNMAQTTRSGIRSRSK
jgi:hypothetical protein